MRLPRVNDLGAWPAVAAAMILASLAFTPPPDERESAASPGDARSSSGVVARLGSGPSTVHLLSTSVTAFPDADADSGKFLAVAGSGSLLGVPIICHIGIPAGDASFDLDVFDGNIGGHWDRIAGGFDYMDFTLYEDPQKDGTGTTLVDSWTQFDMGDDDWSLRTFATTPGAMAPSGHYFYRLVVNWRNPGASRDNNYFKIRTSGQISLQKGNRIAFIGGPNRVPGRYGPPPWEVYDMDPPVWAGDPDPDTNNVDANSYDGEWVFYFYVPIATTDVEFEDGDADYAHDASSPGAPRDGPSPYDGCNVYPDIYYVVTDPNGISHNNWDPSGNLEWETFRITGTLPPGLWDMTWHGMDAHNMNFIEASYEMFSTDDPPLPVSPAPEVVPDNADTVIPGVTVDYAHTITNRGATATFDIVASSSLGWVTRIYEDSNGNGTLDAAEKNAGVVSDTGVLQKNDTFAIIVQVDVPGTSGSVVDTTTVTASSQDEWNVQASAHDTTTVNANQPPVADAGGPYTVDEGSPLQMDGSGSSDPDGDPLTYHWDLDGDGVHDDSNLVDPERTWMDDGTYTVSLRVDDGKLDDIDSAIVTVQDLAPTAAFAWSPEPQDEGSPVQFDDLSTSSPDPIVAWEWDFAGMGTSTDPDPEFTFLDDGVYTVTLTVTDDDGSTSSVSQDVTVLDLAPTAEFTWDPEPQDEGSPVQLDDLSTSNPDVIVAWEWDFGDGGSSTDTNPQHAYGDNGTFTVTLTVTDDDGSTDTVSHTITIDNVAPATDAGDDATIDEGSSLSLSGAFTDPGWLDTHTIAWDFGDGNTASGTLTPSHGYADDGTYTVTLTITDDDGGIGTDTLTVTVNNVAPVIDPFGPFTTDEGTPVDLSATATDPGSDDLTFTWTWGDGTSDDEGMYSPNPEGTFPFQAIDARTHTYGDNSPFTVTLTVADDDGGVATHTTLVTVSNVPPLILDLQAFSYVDLKLRVAGEKYHSVGIRILEDGTEIASAAITREPGNPDEQTATLSEVRVDRTRAHVAMIDYLPNDPRQNGNVWGANPVWIIISGEDGTEIRLHHTFNVRKSFWDDDHWNHIDPWEVSLAPHYSNQTVHFEGTASDPGSDDLEFTWEFGDSYLSGPTMYFNDGSNPDPYPSPDVNPMTATDAVVHRYTDPGTYTVTLTVTDDDGGTTTTSLDLTAESTSGDGARKR